jgi:hypothetical protein
MTRADTLSWTKAKAVGDAAEVAVARWWMGRGFTAHKTVGKVNYDLRIMADIEVKADSYAARTGNFAIEIESGGRPSGIATSRAAYWVLVAGAEGLLVPTPDLRALAQQGCWEVISGGDGGRNKMKLVRGTAVRALPGSRVLTLEEVEPRANGSRD